MVVTVAVQFILHQVCIGISKKLFLRAMWGNVSQICVAKKQSHKIWIGLSNSQRGHDCRVRVEKANMMDRIGILL